MGCFQFSLEDTEWVEIVFYALSLLQVVRALQLTQMLWQEWGDFRQEPLTRRKAWLGEQELFLAIPPVGGGA